MKFFRQNREEQIAGNTHERQNRTSRYLLYAIGEIALVMIGILLALQVNDWNARRLDAKKEQMLLKNLQQDFQTNLTELKKIYNRVSRGHQSGVSLLEIIKSEDVIDPAEAEMLIDRVVNSAQSLDLFSGTIDEIINTGSLNIIRDPALRKQLSNWSFYINDTRDDIVIMNNYLFEFLVPSLTERAILRNTSVPSHFEKDLDLPTISKSGFSIDYAKTIRTLEFENQLYNNTLNYMYTLNSYKIVEMYLEKTLQQIEDNIK